jgi:hypothetical protein
MGEVIIHQETVGSIEPVFCPAQKAGFQAHLNEK